VPDNYDPALLADFKKQAFENGMSNEGVRKMTEWYKNVEMAKAEALNKARAQHSDMQILQLKQEFGTRFDQEVGNARKALDAYTDKEFRKYMDETGLGNHPALVKAFAKIGRELSEDRLVQSETASRLAQDESLKRSEILRLRSDASFMDKYRRGDRAAIERLNRLYEGN
jgi:DNA-binding transcriptional MerR regulator